MTWVLLVILCQNAAPCEALPYAWAPTRVACEQLAGNRGTFAFCFHQEEIAVENLVTYKIDEVWERVGGFWEPSDEDRMYAAFYNDGA